MVLENILIFLAASVVLVKSASFAVKSVSRIATELKFSPFFVAFIFAGFVSILPELFIGINSSLIGMPSVGLGTVIGSNVADMTLLVGIIALAGRKINIGKKTISNSAYFVIITALPIILMADSQLTRDDGLVLILVFFLYLASIIRKEKIMTKARSSKKPIGKNLAIFLLSMLFLFIGAYFMVEAGVGLATEFAAPVILVGLLVIAIGTTLPELTFSLRAVLGKHKEVALGDLLGNVAIDSTFTIGIIALISPITNNFSLVISSSLFMILGALVVTTLMQAGKKITWQESFLLFFIYAMFIIMELLLKGALPAA